MTPSSSTARRQPLDVVAVVLILLILVLVLTLVAPRHRVLTPLLEALRVRRLTASLPGPGIIALLRGGGASTSRTVPSPHRGAYATLNALCETYAATSPAFRLCVAHCTTVFLLRPDDIQAVLTSPHFTGKSSMYAAIEPFVGRGLATLGGEEYRRHRRAIAPSLHLDVLRDFVPVFHKHGAVLAAKLRQCEDRTLDVTPLCGACANSAICETVMSTDVEDGDLGKRAFLDAIPAAQSHFMYRVARPWLLSEWAYGFSARYAEYLHLRRVLDDFTHRIIRDKKGVAQTASSACSTTPRPRRRLAFLDHVLSAPGGTTLGDDELADEVKTLVSIASASSMESLTLFLYTIAIRKDIQEKVWQEVSSSVGDLDRPLTAEDLRHLDYTERVLKEVLRYYSVVPMFGRTCARDVRLPSGVLVPRGCMVALWLPHVHRDPALFPDPDNFDPDRFLPDAASGRHPFAFVPFSAGPRNCIGQRYALMFLKTVAAALVHGLRFDVDVDGPARTQDVPLRLNLTTCVRGGTRLRVQRR